MVKISVYTCGNDHFRDEWYILEGIKSALGFADEIIFVFGGKVGKGIRYHASTHTINKGTCAKTQAEITYSNNDDGTLATIAKMALDDSRIRIYINPWEKRMRTHMTALQKSLALSHCTGDVCVLMDADEVWHEDDYERIRVMASLLMHSEDIQGISFNTLHFYRDYNHIKVAKSWYEGKVYMVKNNEGIFHGKHPDPNSIEPDAHVGLNHRPLHSKLVIGAPTVYHYGHVRSKETYVRKTNEIEHRYHGKDWVDLDPKKWEWDMSGTKEFTGKHPAVMEERIRRFQEG